MVPVSDNEMLRTAEAIRNELISQFPEMEGWLKQIRFRIWSMSACAGKAFPRLRLVKLSRSYYSCRENFDKDFRDTVIHEIAHILTPGAGHKAPWRAMASKLGATPVRCHALSLAKGFKRRRRRMLVVQCDCREKYFPARSYFKEHFTGKDAGYFCRDCRQFLKFVREEMK